jgi:hypothetical protein
VSTATGTATRHSNTSETLESLIGLTLLWLIPVLAFVLALFLG